MKKSPFRPHVHNPEPLPSFRRLFLLLGLALGAMLALPFGILYALARSFRGDRAPLKAVQGKNFEDPLDGAPGI